MLSGRRLRRGAASPLPSLAKEGWRAKRDGVVSIGSLDARLSVPSLPKEGQRAKRDGVVGRQATPTTQTSPPGLASSKTQTTYS